MIPMDALLHLDLEALPRSIAWDHPVSDEQLEALCAGNDVLHIERTKTGEIRVNPPTGLSTSDGNAEIIHQLRLWWKTHRRGIVADSNAGFYLKDGSMLSPDAAYLSPETLETASEAQTKGLPHLCPDFVVELLSKSDSFRDTQEKMQDWIANGVTLGWLIDPYRRQVLVYSNNSASAVVTGDTILGSGPVSGLTLDLSEVWRCYK